MTSSRFVGHHAAVAHAEAVRPALDEAHREQLERARLARVGGRGL